MSQQTTIISDSNKQVCFALVGPRRSRSCSFELQQCCHAKERIERVHLSAASCMLPPMLQAIYVTMFPCCECAKLLIQAGIREVVFFEDKAVPVRPASAPLSGIRRGPGTCFVCPMVPCCVKLLLTHGPASCC